MDVNALQQALLHENWEAAARILGPFAARPDAHPSILYNYGKVLLEQGKAQAAQAVLQRLLAQEAGHVNGWFELGRAALLSEDLGTADRAFAQVLQRTPNDRDAALNLARVRLRLGQFEAAHQLWLQFEGTREADLALYRTAAEQALPEAGERSAKLLRDHPERAAVLKALTRVAKGSLPLRLPSRVAADAVQPQSA